MKGNTRFILANDYTALFESPDPQSVFAYSPGLARTEGGRIVATFEISGPGISMVDGPKGSRAHGWQWQGRVCTSDDHGRSWNHTHSYPFLHSRPFVAGASLYVLGQNEDLIIIRSDDHGDTWSAPVKLTNGQFWHQAPCNVHYASGCVYLVMERRMSFEVDGWYVSELAPILMRGKIDTDLTRSENWTFAATPAFRDLSGTDADYSAFQYHGIPFFSSPFPHTERLGEDRACSPIGWLETNVVRFTDPDHYWFDEDGKTMHLWMRAHTGGTGYACILKVVEQGDRPGTGEMVAELETVPSGKKILYIPCPGGQMKFHVLYDTNSSLFWLLSTQATDSMTRADRLASNRYNLPNNERRRLQLHFSKNMIDWCFAGIVAVGPTENGSRHYASMLIDGDDLHVLSRSGDERAKSAHDGNLITFHSIRNFRDLIY